MQLPLPNQCGQQAVTSVQAVSMKDAMRPQRGTTCPQPLGEGPATICFTEKICSVELCVGQFVSRKKKKNKLENKFGRKVFRPKYFSRKLFSAKNNFFGRRHKEFSRENLSVCIAEGGSRGGFSPPPRSVHTYCISQRTIIMERTVARNPHQLLRDHLLRSQFATVPYPGALPPIYLYDGP